MHLVAPVVTTMSVSLSSSEIHNGDMLVPAYLGGPGKWLLNEYRSP